MTLHLFRPHEAPRTPTPPVGVSPRHRVPVALLPLLARLWELCHRPQVRRILQTCLIVLGLVVQMVLMLTVAYLCDLAISLMELWADLARKHLELTL